MVLERLVVRSGAISLEKPTKEIEKRDEYLRGMNAPTIEELRQRHAKRIKRCWSCGAAIVWFKTKAQKWMPINAETVKASDTKFIWGEHIAHWRTCPNPERHRKRKSGETSRARR